MIPENSPSTQAARSFPMGLLDAPLDAVLLYGSQARGDATPRSDIDVLQIVPQRRPSYRRGRLSVTTTTAESLRALATSGSLFVLHLRKEGVILRDTSRILADILEDYRFPASYDPLRESLRIAAGVLDVGDARFAEDPLAFTQLALYLLRSIVYLRCAEDGRPLFSMRDAADHLGDPRILDVFRAHATSSSAHSLFVRARALLGEHLGSPVKNEFGSIEGLASWARAHNPLAHALANRILEGAPTTYADLLPDGIAT